MKHVGVREFKDKATAMMSSGETLVIQRHGKPIGFFVPVDATVLAGDLLRVAGRERITDERLDLFIPEQQMEEATVEMPRRVAAFTRRHNLEENPASELVDALLTAIAENVIVVDEAVYAGYEEGARARSVRDPDDWPLVASALALDGAVWTHDADLFGTGVATCKG